MAVLMVEGLSLCVRSARSHDPKLESAVRDPFRRREHGNAALARIRLHCNGLPLHAFYRDQGGIPGFQADSLIEGGNTVRLQRTRSIFFVPDQLPATTL